DYYCYSADNSGQGSF
nr:immunoglobulin light chain junction region [Macaca mulatta]MOV72109.1 immunoglobulin light chain junction region [Macaca mulatta]MOV72121.1 immunoglobulin light chain junction region [Macaca mulatta]MOV72131.1 immunoglobulin light chain junction region [Macaca mulatta]MOV72245.1 immunoglobulin light chain junction region [Macaca mulatta]